MVGKVTDVVRSGQHPVSFKRDDAVRVTGRNSSEARPADPGVIPRLRNLNSQYSERRGGHSLLESAEGACRDIKRAESAESATVPLDIDGWLRRRG